MLPTWARNRHRIDCPILIDITSHSFVPSQPVKAEDGQSGNGEHSNQIMRFKFSHGGLSFLVLFLGLVFGARELPELLSLADDVSNDGDIVEVLCPQRSHRSIQSREDAPRTAGWIAPFADALATTGVIPRVGAHPTFGRSLLRLLSLQRK